MATELFQNDTIPRLTWANVFNQSQEGLEVAPVASGGETMIAPTIIGGIFQGASYRSGDSGARFEIFPEEDKNIGCVVYNASGTVVFKTIVDGTDTGDIIVGDYAGGAGAKWDQSASSFDVKGSITSTSGTIGGWTIVSGYIYNLQSGTPGSTENDGMVLASGNTGMTVWENTEKRLELGYLSSGVYGLRIYDTSGSNVIFETSDTQQSISGWHFTTTTLADNATAASANVLIDSANSLIRLGPTAGTYISIDGANQKLESSNYVSGHAGAGFHLDSNLLEVGNIAARGLIRTAVFQKDVISSIGGNFMVADSDVLDANMTALDASSLTTKETTTFELGDILRIKDGTDDEWLEVIARTVDSYSESNQSQEGILYSGSTVKMGQSFTGNGNILYSGKLYLKKSGSPVGNATMTVYAHTGTFGSDGTPTGSALATSDNFDVSTLTTSFALITFSFTGANRITLTNGTNYFVILEYGGGDVSNSVRIGVDNTSPSHGGNAVYYVSSWAALTDDACFYVYGAGSPYALNRDKNSDYAADTNPIWKKGATVVNYGASGDGGIFMTASETNAPYLSIFDHAGSPWDTINTRLRIGNLNGYLGYSTDLYGIAIGETTKYLKYDTTNGLRIRGDVTIDSGSMSVSLLTAGTITSKSIVLAVSADDGDTEIRAGIATGDFANAGDATGFILGIDDSDSDLAKFYVGTPTDYLEFDGTNMLATNVANVTTYTAGEEIGTAGLAVCLGRQVEADYRDATNDIDTWANEASADTNYGTTTTMQIGLDATSKLNYAYIKFDDIMTADMPDSVVSVSIRFYVKSLAGDVTVGANRITETWAENTLTWNNKPAIDESYGTVVLAAGTWKEIDITNLYNLWKEGVYTNYGVALLYDSGSGAGAVAEIWAKGAANYEVLVIDGLADTDKVWKTQGNKPFNTYNFIGFAQNTAAADATVRVLGINSKITGITDSDVAALVPGEKYYLATTPTGTISQTPSTYAYEIGMATNTDSLWIYQGKRYARGTGSMTATGKQIHSTYFRPLLVKLNAKGDISGQQWLTSSEGSGDATAQGCVYGNSVASGTAARGVNDTYIAYLNPASPTYASLSKLGKTTFILDWTKIRNAYYSWEALG